MTRTILQINYQFTSSRADHTALVTPMAESIAATPGLIWKIWLMNEVDREAGGIYLFESREAAQAFVSSPAVKSFAGQPSITAVNAKLFEPVEALSKITRGPLTVEATV